MTVPSSTSRDQQIGNGTTTAFTVPFRILDQTHLRVLLTIAGVTTEQTLTTHYSVSGVGGSNTTVTFVSAPAAAAKVTFLRNVPFTQETDYVPNDPFPAESHERGLDKLTMQLQQLDEIAGENGRTIKIPAEVSGVSTELPTPVANGLWGWDAEGDAPRYYTPAEIATAAIGTNWQYETFPGDGATTGFILSDDPGTVANMDVSIDGVTQVPGTDFSLLGTSLDFAAAPADGAVILVRYGLALVAEIGATFQTIEVTVTAGDTVVAVPGIAAGEIVNVYYNGVFQNPSSYSVAGASIHFTEALPADGQVSAIVADGAYAGSIGSGNLSHTALADGAVTRSVRDKLGDIVSVKDFGAAADGVDHSTKIQKAIDHLSTRGGGDLVFGPGTFRAYNLHAKNNIRLRGAGKNATVLKVPDGIDGTVIQNPDAAAGTTVDYFSLQDMTIDGNAVSAAGVTAVSACSMNGVADFSAINVRFQNASGYGLAMQGYPGGSDGTVQQNIHLQNVDVVDNGDGVGAATYDGLDVKDCDRFTWIGGRATGNADDGVDVRGRSVTIAGVYSDSNGNAGFAAGANNATPDNPTTIRLIGCEARSNATAGFVFDSGAAATEDLHASMVGCVSAGNTLYGVQLPTNDTHVELSMGGCHVFDNVSHGIVASGAAKNLSVVGCDIRDNGGSGIATASTDAVVVGGVLSGNARYGFENTTAGGSRSRLSGVDLRSNTLGPVLQGSNNRTMVMPDCRVGDIGTDDVLASAATVTLPECGDYFVITGTTNITSVAASWRGRRVTLHFNGALTLADGSNLVLAGNLVTANGTTITLVCNGTNWYETGRSAN